MTQRVAGGHDFGKKLDDAVKGKTHGLRDQAAKSGEDAAKAILRRRSRPKSPSDRRWHTTPGAPGAPGPADAFKADAIAAEATAPQEPGEVRFSAPAGEDGEFMTGREVRAKKHEAGTRPFRYRVRYRRLRGLRFLSHLELLKLVYRALTRASLPLRFSEGYHPKPKIAFGPPIPVGVESEDEEMEFYLDEAREPDALLARLREVFLVAQGLEPFEVQAVDLDAPSLQAERLGADYAIDLSPLGLLPGSIADAVRAFEARTELPIDQDRNGEIRKIDLKQVVSGLAVNGTALTFFLRSDVATARAEELVAGMLGLPIELARRARIKLVRAVRKPAVAKTAPVLA